MFSADLLEFIQKSWGIYGLGLLVLIGFILYIPKFVDSLGYFKVLKIRYLNEALDSSHIDNVSKKLLSENLASIYFTKCTGIRANEKERQNILVTYEMLKGKFNINEIYYSMPYITQCPHLLPTSELGEIKDELNNRLKVSNRFKFAMIIIIFICFVGFIHYSIEAYYQNSFFTYKYFNNGFIVGFGLIMGISNYFESTISDHRIRTAKDIIEYIQAIPDEN